MEIPVESEANDEVVPAKCASEDYNLQLLQSKFIAVILRSYCFQSSNLVKQTSAQLPNPQYGDER